MSKELKSLIKDYPDFPKKGIIFKDLLPILQKPDKFSELINSMSSSEICKEAEAIIAIDARGFIFGTAISIVLSKPMIVARKPGKLPGNLITKSYDLEYGNATLELQPWNGTNGMNKVVIVDDVLATGGTLKATCELAETAGYEVVGSLVLIDLKYVPRVKDFDLEVESIVTYG